MKDPNCSYKSQSQNTETQWVISLAGLLNSDTRRNSFSSMMQRISGLESEIGMLLHNSFAIPYMATSGLHGLGHVIRVVLWSGILADLSNEFGLSITENEVRATLYAAFLHDLSRTSEGVDGNHGHAAADRFEDHLRALLPEELYERCLHAIRVHAVNQDPKDQDPVWMLLKDADALDRGRFGPPGRRDACNIRYLRLPIFHQTDELANNLLWNACWLANVTRYINWTDHPFDDFRNAIISSLNLVANAEDVPETLRHFACSLSKELSDQ